ncbi:MAG: hypothetical protein ACJATI_000070 [Halioglobus sp.]|jgi:hypothetical protein
MLKIKREIVDIEEIKDSGDVYYKISNNDLMRPFFMSIVSDSDHWMFISSTGGLSAGRKNAYYSLFPYYTDDKITESSENTGSKTILQVTKNDSIHVWEPFSIRGEDKYSTSRNLYKNRCGNKVKFEEVNHDLGVTFTYEWCSSYDFGFVRESRLTNHSEGDLNITFLDGLQNILPYGVPSDLQSSTSNLVDAYKRSELHEKSGLGIFALSAIIVDKAEPSEALKSNVAWSMGLEDPIYLLSSLQLQSFRDQSAIHQEIDVKGERGAYFVVDSVSLSPSQDKKWSIVANVHQTQSKVAGLIHNISTNGNIAKEVIENIELGKEKLILLNAAADGLQCTADRFRDTRHFANVLFNNMRGGIFDDNYTIERWDFQRNIQLANQEVYDAHKGFMDSLPETFTIHELRKLLDDIKAPHLKRLAIEYLPLKFSRRHGDPSRPWNRFSINMVNEKDGSKILDYEGNWRDIFQNWEAMVHSYPDFIEGMILRFLNASTFDGYNPYRITKDGFDWEISEPDDPWSYIGYWGDHQIIYLLKFLEFIERHQPGKLSEYFTKELFVYANVPYKIKPYESILNDPKDTIEFDEELDVNIRLRREEMGADGALLTNESGDIHSVNLIEKILATVLAKLSNYVPEGGIWMNTQRPEWNDANNALVGNGISMVTLYYLRRFLHFFNNLLDSANVDEIKVSSELLDFYKKVRQTLEDNQDIYDEQVSDEKRKEVLDQLGIAASEYRIRIYEKSFYGAKRSISVSGIKRFVDATLTHLDHTIRGNKRSDGLYHAYNLLTVQPKSVHISYLSEMLEGQVAVLSSGFLEAEEALSVLDSLKSSALFREDQYSYILYPNKTLKGFLDKNIIPENSAKGSALLTKMISDNDSTIVEKDVFGKIHFNGNFRNVNDLLSALDEIADGPYSELVKKEKDQMSKIFEEVFNHKAFTGRSGTFYGYEGLGSIYWHMVSKLLLAVQECCLKAIQEDTDPSIMGRLMEHFYEINEGIGVHKSPSLYGAFPTDPYSHTPASKGAQQPGMTGQVKEDILSRFGELGVFVHDRKLHFKPSLLRKNEFLMQETKFDYIDLNSENQTVLLNVGSLAFTYCQVPIVYTMADYEKIEVIKSDDSIHQFNNLNLDSELSNALFQRQGDVKQIQVYLDTAKLR